MSMYENDLLPSSQLTNIEVDLIVSQATAILYSKSFQQPDLLSDD